VEKYDRKTYFTIEKRTQKTYNASSRKMKSLVKNAIISIEKEEKGNEIHAQNQSGADISWLFLHFI
jgi:predicted aspartyl protease